MAGSASPPLPPPRVTLRPIALPPSGDAAVMPSVGDGGGVGGGVAGDGVGVDDVGGVAGVGVDLQGGAAEGDNSSRSWPFLARIMPQRGPDAAGGGDAMKDARVAAANSTSAASTSDLNEISSASAEAAASERPPATVSSILWGGEGGGVGGAREVGDGAGGESRKVNGKGAGLGGEAPSAPAQSFGEVRQSEREVQKRAAAAVTEAAGQAREIEGQGMRGGTASSAAGAAATGVGAVVSVADGGNEQRADAPCLARPRSTDTLGAAGNSEGGGRGKRLLQRGEAGEDEDEDEDDDEDEEGSPDGGGDSFSPDRKDDAQLVPWEEGTWPPPVRIYKYQAFRRSGHSEGDARNKDSLDSSRASICCKAIAAGHQY